MAKRKYLPVNRWLAELIGATAPQVEFYSELFQVLFEDGKVYADQVEASSPRSRRKWLARLCGGDSTQVGLEVLERHREGQYGSWYYRWNADLASYLSRSYKGVVGCLE